VDDGLLAAADFIMTSETNPQVTFSPSSPQRPFSTGRWLSVLLRSVHISTMAILLGGVFLSAGHDEIRAANWAALLSGCFMLFMDILKSPRVLLQGSGLFVLLKLALLSVGFFFLPGQRFYWYLAATFIASIGSHMPSGLRHCDILCIFKNRERRQE
jgi:hypothetical protein